MQQLNYDVFSFTMYTDESFFITKEQMKKRPFMSLFLDATGSVVKQMDGMKKRPFYYALSLAGMLCFNNSTYV